MVSQSNFLIYVFSLASKAVQSPLTDCLAILGLEVSSSLCFFSLVTKTDARSEMVLSNNSDYSADETISAPSRPSGEGKCNLYHTIYFFVCYLAAFLVFFLQSQIVHFTDRCLTLSSEVRRSNACPLYKFHIPLRHIEGEHRSSFHQFEYQCRLVDIIFLIHLLAEMGKE